MTDVTETPEDLSEKETVDALAAAQALLGEEGVQDLPVPDESAEAAESEPILPGVEMPPPLVPPTLDPQPPRRNTRGKGKGGGKKKNPFSEMVGAGERLLVHKRDPINGQLTYIGQYSPEDLMRSGNVDIFLQEYIVPKWKEGEFTLSLQALDGTLKHMGSRKIAAPPGSQGSGSGTETSLAEIVKLQQQMEDKAKKESADEMKNMVTMLTAMKAMNPPKEGAAPDPMASMMPMMMMMMMMNGQKSSGPDPMLMMLLSRLDRADDTPPPAPMPFPMAPAADSSLTDVATLIQALRPTQQSTTTQDLVAMAGLFKNDNGQLTMKDMITLAPTLKELFNGGGDKSSFRETVENLGMLQNLAQGLGTPEEGGFWDFAQAMVGNLPALGDIINARRNGKTLPKTTTETTQAGTPSKKNTAQVPPIPDGFEKHSKLMMQAQADDDDGQMIEQCLRGLLFLRKESDKWKPYVENCFTFAHREDKEKSMKYIETFLQTFIDREFVSPECANDTYQAFEDNWDQVLVGLGFKKAGDVSEDEDPDAENPDSEDEGIRVVDSETVAEAEQDDVDEGGGVPEVDDDDAIEMSDEEIARLSAQADAEGGDDDEPAAEEITTVDPPSEPGSPGDSTVGVEENEDPPEDD